MQSRKALILVNVGTPDGYDVRSVRQYLREFLNDPRVISIPPLFRKVLVNGIIVPFRAPKSATLYQKLWTEKGSPLLCYTQEVRDLLGERIGKEYDVFSAMRYGNPSLRDCLKKVYKENYDAITLFPLYPQYASSTTGSVADLVYSFFKKKALQPSIKLISNFYSDAGFIRAFALRIQEHDLSQYDHILFSYHGLPVSHVEATHSGKSCEDLSCKEHVTKENRFCYHAACYKTTRLIIKELEVSKNQCSVAFQSRFGKRWLTPSSSNTLVSLAQKGKRRVLVVAPSFVTDCLETTVEICYELRELFMKSGGERLDLVEGLNTFKLWVEYLAEKVTS